MIAPATATDTMNEDGTTPLFIFDPREFEQTDFSCASFVVKYQQVLPLINLKQDLHLFLEDIRKQLYDVVNQNYSDFINIAMKLEGVDVRISCMQSPLSSIRMDVNGLYDIIVNTLTTLQNTLRNKQSLYEREDFLENARMCLNHIDMVEFIINPHLHPDDKHPPSQARHRRNQLKHSISKIQSLDKRKDTTHLCSEIERAAYLLADADSSLSSIDLSTLMGSSEELRVERLTVMHRDLMEKLQGTRNKLLVKISELLTEILQTGVSHPLSTAGPAASSLFPHRSLIHLVRALVSLGRGEVCEQIVAERVVHPLLRTALAQGKVDGPEGRNSFSGLPSALEHLMNDVSARLGNVVFCCEEEFADGESETPVDIVLHGIWLPVMMHLESRFEGLFSSAIASTFHTCYSSVEWLTNTCAALGGSTFAPMIRSRMRLNKQVQELHSKWKLDLYVLVSYLVHSFYLLLYLRSAHKK